MCFYICGTFLKRQLHIHGTPKHGDERVKLRQQEGGAAERRKIIALHVGGVQHIMASSAWWPNEHKSFGATISRRARGKNIGDVGSLLPGKRLP